MRANWVVLAALGATVVGCSSAATVAHPTAVATAAPAPSPTATSTATPSPAASAQALSAPSPSPTASPTPNAADPSLGLDGFTRTGYVFRPGKGQVFSIVLPGHSTEGLKWALATGFDANVASGTGQSRPGAKPAGAGNGVSPPQVFDFTATGSGTTSLSFDLVMPSAPQKAPAENRKFIVNVL